MSELSLSLPEYDQEAYDSKYAELTTYRFDVPSDVMAVGYKGMNELYSKLFGMISRVDEMLAEANRCVAAADGVYIACKSAYEAKTDAKLGALTKDQYESIKIVEAKVRSELAEELRSMQRAKLVLGLFKAYRTTVEGKRKNLGSAFEILENQNNNLKRQLPPPPGQAGRL